MIGEPCRAGQSVLSCASRLLREERANVLMLAAFAMLPLVFVTGMGIDYAHAMKLQTRLSAAADSAALAAVAQPVMAATPAQAAAIARQMFVSQITGLYGLQLNAADPAQLSITVTDADASSISRTVTVAFSGQSTNTFAGILGVNTLSIRGTSATNATIAPNIDFYLMLDTSPSMALPQSAGGLSQLTSLTNGCAFACHETNPKAEGINVRDQAGNSTDYYGLARSYGITLRVDAEKSAVQSLMTTAQNTSQVNGASYRMALNSFDVTGDFKNLEPLTSNLSDASAKAGNLTLLQVYTNNFIQQNVNNNDQDTDFTDAFANVVAQLPNSPGNGTNQPGDTPQAMVFIITDGMRDENAGGSRVMGAIPPDQCTAIKARGIRIAILYTQYLPQSLSDGWSQANVAPLLPNVAPALQSCSSSGLFYQVTTGDDITAALNGLFQKAVATAHITQ